MTEAAAEALERINEQVEEQEDDVQEISLDTLELGKLTPEIKAAIEKHKDTLVFLSLNECQLTSLENFPNLPKLSRLELTDNKIPGSELAKLASFTDLQSLSFGGNQLKEFKDLEALKGLSQLAQLDLFGCPIENSDDYRKKVFEIFKELSILDNKDQEGNDVDYEEGESGDEGDEGEEFDEGDDDDDDEEEEEEEEKPKKKTKKN